MARLTRDYEVRYGSLVIGGANTEIELDGPVSVRIENDTAYVSCRVWIKPDTDTDAAYEALEDTVFDAMRTPRQRLRIIVGAETLHDFDPAAGANTSGNCKPTYEEPGDLEADSRRSRRLNLSWAMDLNADPYGQDGRRDSQVTVSYTANGILTINIAGEYRADSAFDNARDRYTASISAFATSVLAPFVSAGLVIEALERPQITVDDTNYICTFSQNYREVIADQALGTRDFTPVRNPMLHYRRNLNSPGDSPGVTVSRLQTVTVSYRTEVDKDNTDLVGLWQNTIRPLILAGAQQRWPGGVGLLDETYGPSVYDNVLEGSMTLLVTSGGDILSYTLTWTTTDDPGEVEDTLGTDGEFDRFVYQSNRSFTLTLQSQTRYLQLLDAPDDPSSSRPPGVQGGGIGGAEAGAQGIQIGYNRNRGQAVSRQLWDLTPGGPTSSQQGGADGGQESSGAAGEWSKPIINRGPVTATIGQAGYEIPVTDETVTVIRRWRVPYQAPTTFKEFTGDSDNVNDPGEPDDE